MSSTLLNSVVNAVVFAFLGIVVFTVAFLVMDKLTPYHLWKEIVQEHNMALAILVGAMSIGMHHHRGRGALNSWEFCFSFRCCSSQPAA